MPSYIFSSTVMISILHINCFCVMCNTGKQLFLFSCNELSVVPAQVNGDLCAQCETFLQHIQYPTYVNNIF